MQSLITSARRVIDALRLGGVRAGIPILLVLAGLLAPLRAGADGPPQVVILRWSDRAQVERWAARGWDIWEVGDGWARAALSPSQIRATGPALAAVESPPTSYAAYPACYRTVDAMLGEMQAWQQSAPDLVELSSAGPSWETTQGLADRQLWTARLTNPAVPGPKPKFFLVGNHHARELITPELVLRFGRWLIDHYGVDGDATWILDHTEVWLMPTANPDGHVKAEQNLDWRKNTNTSNGSCAWSTPPDSAGIDLNRNYSYAWGGASSSGDACSLLYRGPEPFSEPETQAVRDLVSRERFDLLISLHSYGDLIIYPWNYSHVVPTPDEPAFRTLAARLSRWNGYATGQAGEVLYNFGGDTTDWAYATHGILGLTFEIGDYLEGAFWPECEAAEEQWLENLPALIYAAKAAAAPKVAPFGPVVEELSGPTDVFRPEPITVTATLRDDRGEAGQSVIGGSLVLTDGTILADFAPVDGAWGDPVEAVTATVSLAGVAPGARLLVAHGVDGGAVTGVPGALLVTVYDGRLRLTVRDAESGQPVVGASVRLWDRDGNARKTTTGAEGEATLDSLSGPVSLEVYASCYSLLTEALTLEPDQVTHAAVELRPKPIERCSLRVSLPVITRGFQH